MENSATASTTVNMTTTSHSTMPTITKLAQISQPTSLALSSDMMKIVFSESTLTSVSVKCNTELEQF